MADELWVAEKFQSNSEIAGSPRNSFRASLVDKITGGRALNGYIEALATVLCKRLRLLYPQMLSERYKLGDMSQYEELSDYDLFLTIGKKRGFLISGGEINTERTAIMLLDEFRACKLGRITLDRYSKEELHA